MPSTCILALLHHCCVKCVDVLFAVPVVHVLMEASSVAFIMHFSYIVRIFVVASQLSHMHVST